MKILPIQMYLSLNLILCIHVVEQWGIGRKENVGFVLIQIFVVTEELLGSPRHCNLFSYFFFSLSIDNLTVQCNELLN